MGEEGLFLFGMACFAEHERRRRRFAARRQGRRIDDSDSAQAEIEAAIEVAARLVGSVVTGETLVAFVEAHLEHRPKLPGSDPEAQWRVLERFLLSTDFFNDDAGGSRPLRFAAYYDPYVNPCYNPLVHRG